MKAKDLVDPLIDSASALVSGEIDHWRREITRPWRVGRRGRVAEVSRWIGFGLAVGAVAAGVIAALRAEPPWE